MAGSLWGEVRKEEHNKTREEKRKYGGDGGGTKSGSITNREG